ncbi:hypothetical protein A4G19_13365 [Pasteurellaceae bacterium Macca]|nr:hypothetical protein [Pasteurellaceae bacterium Macca]
MKYVIFARDRKRKKNRLKAFIFLLALLSLFLGIVMVLKSQNTVFPTSPRSGKSLPIAKEKIDALPPQHSTILSEESENTQAKDNQDNHEDDKNVTEKNRLTNVQEQSPTEVASKQEENALHHEPTYIDIDVLASEKEDSSHAQHVDETATSYEDDLDEDDTFETNNNTATENTKNSTENTTLAQNPTNEISHSTNNGEPLPPEAENALNDFLSVADQAIRIQNQFSYTVTRGDTLKDVLEQSGVSNATAHALEKHFPQLASLQSGQQFYWILDSTANWNT